MASRGPSPELVATMLRAQAKARSRSLYSRYTAHEVVMGWGDKIQSRANATESMAPQPRSCLLAWGDNRTTEYERGIWIPYLHTFRSRHGSELIPLSRNETNSVYCCMLPGGARVNPQVRPRKAWQCHMRMRLLVT